MASHTEEEIKNDTEIRELMSELRKKLQTLMVEHEIGPHTLSEYYILHHMFRNYNKLGLYKKQIDWGFIANVDIIDSHPDANWDWVEISNNQSITIDFVEKYIDKPWDFKYFTNISKIGKDELTASFILKHMDKDWDWRTLSEREEGDCRYHEAIVEYALGKVEEMKERVKNIRNEIENREEELKALMIS